MTLEESFGRESAVLLDRTDLSDKLKIDLNVANAIYLYEAINLTVFVEEVFKVRLSEPSSRRNTFC